MKRKLLYLASTIAALHAISLMICNQIINKHAESKIYATTDTDSIPQYKVGLLLGKENNNQR